MRLPPRLGLSWLLLAVLAWSPAAAAEPSAGFSSDEVALTLVADEPGADGSIRAALSIDLAPGWKTYWIDPGDAGIPPSVDLSGSSNVVVESLSFPPPHRFGDEYASSNGYSGPMAIALRLRHFKLQRSNAKSGIMSNARLTFRSFLDSFFAFFSLSVFSFLSFTLILTPPPAPGRFVGAGGEPLAGRGVKPHLPVPVAADAPLDPLDAVPSEADAALTVAKTWLEDQAR